MIIRIILTQYLQGVLAFGLLDLSLSASGVPRSFDHTRITLKSLPYVSILFFLNLFPHS